MRILLDECVPRRLARDLAGHDVRTAPAMGWASKRNGELLRLAEGHFDLFVTVDRNLSFQQDVGKFELGVVVLVAASNRYADLQPLLAGLNREAERRGARAGAAYRCLPPLAADGARRDH